MFSDPTWLVWPIEDFVEIGLVLVAAFALFCFFADGGPGDGK
jgi:hypothetical protein